MLATVVEPTVVTQSPELLIAVGVIITAITGLLGAVTVLLNALNKNTKIVEKKVDDVHVLVNNANTDQTREIASLVRSLADAGLRIPDQYRATPTGIPPSTSSVEGAKGRAPEPPIRPHRKTDDVPPAPAEPVVILEEGMELTGTVVGVVTPVVDKDKEKK